MREIKLDKGTAIINDRCVNSKYKARFLSEENEEYCQCCFGECKVEVMVAYNGNSPYQYILTVKEINNLP